MNPGSVVDPGFILCDNRPYITQGELFGGLDMQQDPVQEMRPGQIRRHVWGLAWPVVSRMFMQSIVGMVDIMMVGRLGPASIAAVSVGNRLVFILIAALQALAVGSSALVAQYTGAKRKEQADAVVWQALYGAFLLAAVLATLGAIFAPQLIGLMLSLMETIDQQVLAEGTIYLRIILISMIFGLPQIVINALLQGTGDMKTPLVIMTISNVINVIGNYVLIFGVGPFPAMGVTGAAIATGGSRAIGAMIGVGFLLRGTPTIHLRVSKMTWRLRRDIVGRIMDIGIPASIEQLIRNSSMILFSFLVAGLGTVSMAANEIAMNIQSLSMMPGFGFGLAATTLVGQQLGARQYQRAQDYGRETMNLAMALMITLGLLMFTFPGVFVRLYTTDPAVIPEAIGVLRVLGLIQPFFAVYLVLSGALRGAGDTRFVMIATAVGNWGVRVVLALLVAFYFDAGLVGFWLAIAVDLMVRAGLIFYRYQSGVWRKSLVEAPVTPKKRASA